MRQEAEGEWHGRMQSRHERRRHRRRRHRRLRCCPKLTRRCSTFAGGAAGLRCGRRRCLRTGEGGGQRVREQKHKVMGVGDSSHQQLWPAHRPIPVLPPTLGIAPEECAGPGGHSQRAGGAQIALGARRAAAQLSQAPEEESQLLRGGRLLQLGLQSGHSCVVLPPSPLARHWLSAIPGRCGDHCWVV